MIPREKMAVAGKLAFTLVIKDTEPQSAMRKSVFAAALKLLPLFRAHRAVHVGGTGAAAFAPSDDDEQDEWMPADPDLVAAVDELDAELTIQDIKDKIDATTGARAVGNEAKRANSAGCCYRR